MSAQSAVAVAEQYAQMLLTKEDIVRQTFDRVIGSAFDTIREGHIQAALTGSPAALDGSAYTTADRLAASKVGGRGYAEIRFTAQEAAQRRLWQQHRIVYDIDPDLWAELGDTETDTVIPLDLFTRLPHPDPFIAFPEPLVLPIDEDTRQVIHGFFVRGNADLPGSPGARIQTSTHHPAATNLGATFGGLIETTDGQPVFVPGLPGLPLRDAVWTRVTLDPRVGAHTVAEMIDATIQRFTGYKQAGDWAEDVPRMIRRAVSLLVYLCATNADLTPLPRQTAARSSKKSKDARKPKPSQVIGVGYRVGAALAAYRKQERDEVAAAVHTGRKVAPHIRRAHFHTYRVGAGRRETEVKWLAPIPINVHGEAEQSTVIPVHRPIG